MSDFDALVEKAARELDQHLTEGAVESGCSLRCWYDGDEMDTHLATDMLLAIGLPALLERVEAAEREVKVAHDAFCDNLHDLRIERDAARAERDALAAKVADAQVQVNHLDLVAKQVREQGDVRQVVLDEDGVGERIALAIEAERDNTDRPDMFESGHWNGLDAAAAIARTALTEGTEGA